VCRISATLLSPPRAAVFASIKSFLAQKRGLHRAAESDAHCASYRVISAGKQNLNRSGSSSPETGNRLHLHRVTCLVVVLTRKYELLLMWKRIGQITVASVLFVAGSCSAGWIAAHSEYCQYGDYIGAGKCDACVVATLVVDTITWSASATLPMLILVAAAAACLLSCSLHKSHGTLMQLVVVRGAQRNLRFTPVQHTTNIFRGGPCQGRSPK
jgi:hypothetical protein